MRLNPFRSEKVESRKSLSVARTAAIKSRQPKMHGSAVSYAGAYRVLSEVVGSMTQAGDADADLSDQNLLRERSLDLYRNQPMVKGAFLTHRSNTIGAGLKLQSRIDNDAPGISEDQTAEIERQWRIYSEDPYDCDVEQTKTFGDIQDLALISELLVGEAFVVLPQIDRGGAAFKTR